MEVVMSSVYQILADNATSISELKKNPMAVLAQAGGMPVAVLNRNQPAFYCIPAKAYERLMEKLEDIELAKLIKERQSSDEIELSLDDL
jgi:antitoxin StbD